MKDIPLLAGVAISSIAVGEKELPRRVNDDVLIPELHSFNYPVP